MSDYTDLSHPSPQQPAFGGINIKRIAFITFWALLGSLILHSALLHFTIIHLSGVQEYREGAIVDTAHLLMRGENPYSLNNLPTHTNVYGLTLSAIMAGLSPLLDPSLVNHRIVSGICILLSCMVLASIAHKSGLSYRDSLFCGVFYYVLINLSYSILARPDGIGLLVMFLCVRLAMVDPRHRFGWMALAASILLGCLAYFTKPYLFFGAGCAAVYIGWHRSLKLAVIYWMALVFALVAMIGMAKVIWPMYWYSTFEIHKLANTPSAGHFWSQWGYFSLTHSGWALAIAFIIPGFLRQFPRKNIFSQSFYSGIWSQGFGSRMGGPLGWVLCGSINNYIECQPGLASRCLPYIFSPHLIPFFPDIRFFITQEPLHFYKKNRS